MDLSRVTWRKASYSNSDGGNCVEVGVWRKASYSGSDGGDCVEVGAWRKASYSGANGGECVEVGAAGRAVAVRDSKDPQGPKLAFAPDAWEAFIREVKAGGFDLA
jgi:Domain of unknown function (DUF397)